MRMSIADPNYSGSTACVVIVHGHKLISANAGCSKAILVDKQRQVRVLTDEHKPNVPSERKRIEAKGGRIAQASVKQSSSKKKEPEKKDRETS